jgi:uncharacterized protein (DUF2252 family)
MAAVAVMMMMMTERTIAEALVAFLGASAATTVMVVAGGKRGVHANRQNQHLANQQQRPGAGMRRLSLLRMQEETQIQTMKVTSIGMAAVAAQRDRQSGERHLRLSRSMDGQQFFKR